MSTLEVKGLGQRQITILKYLERHGGTSDLDTLAVVLFDNRHRRSEAKKAAEKLEARGLVTIERNERGEALSVSLAAS